MASGSQVQFDFSVSVKMIRVPGYFWSVSLQTYQLRALEPGWLRAGALEPGVLVGGVVDDELGDDAQAALVAPRWMKRRKSFMRPEIGIDVADSRRCRSRRRGRARDRTAAATAW